MPLIATLEMLTAVPPVFVTVSVSAKSLPTVTLPKLRLVGFDPSVPGVTAVPESAIVNVGFDPSEVMVTLPLAAPAVVGAKLTLNVVLCDAFRVRGAVMPLSVNPAPLIDAAEISTLDPPVLVKVTVCKDCCPIVTLPKFSLVGLNDSCPEDVVDEVPTPLSGSCITEFDALLVIDSVALNVPAAAGENVMLIGALCPAAMVSGRLVEVRENWPAEIVATDTVRDAFPELVALKERVLLFPAATLPKLRPVVARESVPSC